MLADFNTHSNTPTAGSELGTVVIKDCKFLACSGSISIRGVQATPTESCEITGNVFEYGTSQDALFWSAVECNNAKKVIFKNNTVTGARINANERGVLQVWSKSDGNWFYDFQGNTCSGFDYLLQLAANSSFYSPDQLDDRNVAKSEAGKITDVLFGMSLHYPWDSGLWAPINVARYASSPTTAWADSLQNK
jgi:hypothetical protein